MNYIEPAVIHTIAEQTMVKYSKRTIYYNYRAIAKGNALETIHTKGGKLSAATIVFEDGSELIITKEIVAVVTAPKRSY